MPTTVEDIDVELVELAGTDNIEAIVGRLVRCKDVGTVKTECVDGDSEGAVNGASNLIVALHGDDIALGGIYVEVVGHRFASGGSPVAKYPTRVVTVFREVGEVDNRHFGVNIVGRVFEIQNG